MNEEYTPMGAVCIVLTAIALVGILVWVTLGAMGLT